MRLPDFHSGPPQPDGCPLPQQKMMGRSDEEVLDSETPGTVENTEHHGQSVKVPFPEGLEARIFSWLMGAVPGLPSARWDLDRRREGEISGFKTSRTLSAGEVSHPPGPALCAEASGKFTDRPGLASPPALVVASAVGTSGKRRGLAGLRHWLLPTTRWRCSEHLPFHLRVIPSGNFPSTL